MEEMFVLVTRATADNGRVVVHTYGPYPSRSIANSERQKALRSAERSGYTLEASACKVIDTEGMVWE